MLHNKRLLTDMAYEDYAVLIAHMDGELYFRKRRQKDEHLLDPFTKPSDLFAKQCREYREGMVKYWNAFQGQPSKRNDPYQPHLYNPVSFVTFGDTDCISVVAIDDFNPIINLTSQSLIPIRQTSLAFCPSLKSLELESKRLDSDNPNSPQVFCDAKDLCKPESIGAASKRNEKRKLSLSESPLFSVNYFKLNGMAILGPGLLFQQAVYRAMGKRILTSLKKLSKFTSFAEKNQIYSKSDVDSFRCIFLDPQGWADICTLMFCRNYSVIMSVLVDLRQLDFSKLYQTVGGRTLEDSMKCFGLHSKITDESERIAREQQKEDAVSFDPLLKKNHIFCSTYTTLGISSAEFKQGNVQCSGYVIADTEVEIDPGHLPNAKIMAAKKELEVVESLKKLNSKRFHWCTIGQGDSSFPHLIKNKHGLQKSIRMSDLLNQIKSIRDCDEKSRKYPHTRLAPHILEVCTNLHIPVFFSPREEAKNTHMDMRSVLSRMQDRLFIGSEGLFEFEELYASLRKLRISAPLSHSIINLFTDFAACIGDPFLFERVLDLLDVFTTTYRLLAQELPSALDGELEVLSVGNDVQYAHHVCRSFLSNQDIENLVELVKLLENALSHRKQIGFRDAKRWSPSLDVRGGSLDKLVNSADSTLKCGLGILRRVMNGWTKAYQPPEKREDEENRSRIGGASAISCDLRSLTHQLRIGPIEDIFLASIDLNIIHLTRPSAFCIHLHETAHLICELLGSQGCECDLMKLQEHPHVCYKNHEQVITDMLDQNILERHQDIFSEMLVHFFVFGNDFSTYFRDYMANYSLDPIAHCRNDGDAFRRMFEVLIRGFLITDPFRVEKTTPLLYSMKNRGAISKKDIQRAFRRFNTAVKDAGPFFPDFSRLWSDHAQNTDFEEYIFDKFSKVYARTHCAVCCIWQDVNQIFVGVTKDSKDNSGNLVFGTDLTTKQGATSVQRAVVVALRSGRPFVRTLFRVRDRNHADEKQGRLDPFFLMRLLLNKYITSLLGSDTINTREAALWLVRRTDTGQPEPEARPKETVRWHNQLVDRNCNGLFSVDPDTRNSYMRKRIVVIKTLWDISTNLRARRLKSILDKLSPGKLENCLL